MIDTAGLKDILSILDDIANRPTTMEIEDITDLNDARERLSTYVNAPYDDATNRYTMRPLKLPYRNYR